MLLAIDVGNTQTVLGLYEADKLLHMWRVATNKLHTSDELRIKVKPLFESEDIDASKVDGAVLASVVPRLTESWHDAMVAMLGKEPLVVDARAAGDLFKSTYAHPAEVGADRVADAVAARILFGSPCIVVDFGTATNIEVIDEQGFFIGGVIAPGIETSANALFSRATKLAAIDLVDPGTAIGGTTEEAIQAGIVYGEADRVDGLMRRIFKQLGYETQVIATGGLAESVARLSETITEVVPELTLDGLRLIYDAQK